MKSQSVPREKQNNGAIQSDEGDGRPSGSAPVTDEVQTKNTAVKNGDGVAKNDKDDKSSKPVKSDPKKKKKKNLWPLKAMVISLVLSFAVNAGSELVLEGAQLWIAALLTVIILTLGVIFDMIGTAATSCDVQPFLAMASRKVKGAKTAVKLAKNCDVVSSVCCDVVGDICGVVSGVCAATIAVKVTEAIANISLDFWVSVLIYALISTATISLKAAGKRLAVNKANGIVFNVAKILSVFSREK